MSSSPPFERLQRLEEQLERRRRIFRIPRTRLRDRENPYEVYDDFQFKIRFHIFKDTALFITNIIREDIIAPLKRGTTLNPMIQFLITQRYYATGSFQIVSGDLINVCQPTVSNVVKRVSIAIDKQEKVHQIPNIP